MKAIAFSLLLALLAPVGCGVKDKAAQAVTDASNVITAPVDYLGAIGKAKIAAEKQTGLASLGQAITVFRVDNGRLPKDLQELVTEKILPRLPDPPYGMKFSYDPQTGKVEAVPK